MNLVFADGKLVGVDSAVKTDSSGPYGLVQMGKAAQPDRLELMVITAAWEARFCWSRDNRPVEVDRHTLQYRLDYHEGRHPDVKDPREQECAKKSPQATSAGVVEREG